MKWDKIEYPWNEMGNRELFDEFIQFFGFDRMAFSGFVGSYERLLYGKRTYNNVKGGYGSYCRTEDMIPDCDHGRLFKRQGTKQIVYVNQPYGFDKEALEKWCNERELIYVICDKKHSFYYPDNTDMVLIMSNDTYIDFLKLPGFPYRVVSSNL